MTVNRTGFSACVCVQTDFTFHSGPCPEETESSFHKLKDLEYELLTRVPITTVNNVWICSSISYMLAWCGTLQSKNCNFCSQ